MSTQSTEARACSSRRMRLTGRGVRAWRRASAGALGLALVLACAAGCASTDADGPAPEGYVTASEFGAPLGLRELPRESSGRVVLADASGARIAFFPGSTTATVRGMRLDTVQPVEYADGRAWLEGSDAARLSRVWTTSAPRLDTGPDLRPWNTGVVRRPAPPPPALPPRPGDLHLPPHVTPPSSPTPAPGPVAGSNAPTRGEIGAWGVPLRRRWNYLVIHHSATPSGNAASFDRAHRDRGWDGLGYDFVIGNGNGSPNGAIEVGDRWRQQKTGAHAGNDLMNQQGIGICLVGDFTKSRPTAAQMKSLERLCGFLAAYCGIGADGLRRHGDFRETECPGTFFPQGFAFTAAPGVRRGVVASSGPR